MLILYRVMIVISASSNLYTLPFSTYRSSAFWWAYLVDYGHAFGFNTLSCSDDVKETKHWCKLIVWLFFYSHMSQRLPAHPCGHEHWIEPEVSEQTPPFWHGLVSQPDVGTIERMETKHNYIKIVLKNYNEKLKLDYVGCIKSGLDNMKLRNSKKHFMHWASKGNIITGIHYIPCLPREVFLVRKAQSMYNKDPNLRRSRKGLQNGKAGVTECVVTIQRQRSVPIGNIRALYQNFIYI